MKHKIANTEDAGLLCSFQHNNYGGIGVGFSVKYGWQAVFNTFGALAIAEQTYGLKGTVSLRVIQNVFGVAFALVFCIVFYWMMSKSCKFASNRV